MDKWKPRVELKYETRHQSSTDVKILKWMQQNPEKTVSITSNTLAKNMKNEVPGSEEDLIKAIRAMVVKGVLTRSGSRRCSNWHINYMYPGLPSTVLEDAPDDIKDKFIALRAERAENLNQPTITEEKVPEVVEKVQETEQEIVVPVNTDQGITINLNIKLVLSK